jgi:X-X-X-Leu-X-X-Gly heptad repeat protein
MRSKTIALLLLAPALLVACSNEDKDGGGGGGMSVSIAEPAKDAKVTMPFTVKVDAGVPLGPTESGKHHVHLWFDNDANDYAVVESDSVQIAPGLQALSGKAMQLTDGMHTIHISLRNANHSAAGADTQIEVQVAGAATAETPAPAPTSTSSDDPYEY